MSFSSPGGERAIAEMASVGEMCRMLGLSKSRYYALQRSGVLPQASAYVLTSRRPVFFIGDIFDALDVLNTNIGTNGQVVSLNIRRKPTKWGKYATARRAKSVRKGLAKPQPSPEENGHA